MLTMLLILYFFILSPINHFFKKNIDSSIAKTKRAVFWRKTLAMNRHSVIIFTIYSIQRLTFLEKYSDCLFVSPIWGTRTTCYKSLHYAIFSQPKKDMSCMVWTRWFLLILISRIDCVAEIFTRQRWIETSIKVGNIIVQVSLSSKATLHMKYLMWSRTKKQTKAQKLVTTMRPLWTSCTIRVLYAGRNRTEQQFSTVSNCCCITLIFIQWKNKQSFLHSY